MASDDFFLFSNSRSCSKRSSHRNYHIWESLLAPLSAQLASGITHPLDWGHNPPLKRTPGPINTYYLQLLAQNRIHMLKDLRIAWIILISASGTVIRMWKWCLSKSSFLFGEVMISISSNFLLTGDKATYPVYWSWERTRLVVRKENMGNSTAKVLAMNGCPRNSFTIVT